MPAMNAVPAISESMRADVERALRQLRRGADPARVVDELSRRLTNKLLHAPLRALSRA